MTTKTAKLFKSGRSQAVRLPDEFRFEGEEVVVRRLGNGVLIEPMPKKADMKAVFDAIDAIGAPFMPEGREQPPMRGEVKEWFAALDQFREPFPERDR